MTHSPLTVPAAQQVAHEETTWAIEEKDFAGYAAEAVVAHLLKQNHDDTRWFGGTNKGWDVVAGLTSGQYSKRAAAKAHIRVDAKRAVLTQRPLTSTDNPEPTVEFMGTAREEQARPDVTHYGLVVFCDDQTVGNADVEPTSGTLTVNINATYNVTRVFLVPREQVNTLFRRWLKADGEQSKGLVLCAPLAALTAYEVAL